MGQASPPDSHGRGAPFHSNAIYSSLEEKYHLYGDMPARLGGEPD